ncbi:oligosaccharide flippase family protein [Acidiphilium sp. AL]|uniref:Oligosaccharide flippase family protein n=1 Tax=Acidiphilium iwatense TaxID=768198 RepID=A0ABS9DTS9_9PROT|nr:MULTISPECIES: oligosaccharide flippase family protein [Acidiphilium]MCF3945131.1 oligosaccharide flippase family protein [Acidiphilium iwatense]MCU4160524.1 oligosaccharide flippase family protein [Acidiphilium sp. AL]
MSLGRGAARGAAWNLASVLGERSLGFTVLVILLRHVSVRDVGVVAIASAISEIGRMITTGGSGEQVIASPGDRTVEAGAFWAQFLLALAAAGLLFAAAPLLAHAYGAQALGWVTRALAVNIVTGAFLIVPSARLAQRFGFRALSLMSFGSTALGGAAALALVFTGHGLGALVAQRMVGIAFFAAAASIAARWRPPVLPPLSVIRAALRFNIPMMGAAFVDYIAATGYVVLIGARMPVVAVGQFRIAQRLAEVLQELAIFPASKVFLPVFVAVRENPERRFAVAKTLMDALAIVSLGAAAMAGAAAKPIVVLMFGARWAEAAPVFAAMSLIVPAAALYAFVNPMLTALKRPGLVSSFAALNALTIALAAWVSAPFGLVPLAWTLAARGALAALVLLPALSIGIGRSAWPLLRLFAAPLIALVAARIAAAVLLRHIAPATPLIAQLVLGAGIAGLTFLAVLMLFAPSRVIGLVRRLIGAFRRVPAVPETV